jgi:hypothetical protein
MPLKIENAQNIPNLDDQMRVKRIGVPCLFVAHMDGLTIQLDSLAARKVRTLQLTE